MSHRKRVNTEQTAGRQAQTDPGKVPKRPPRARLPTALVCAVFFLPWLATGQTNAVRGPVSNRYLLIVERSHAMQKRAEGTTQLINDLFRSSMGGQLRPGDSVGLWTYNEELYGGRFPVQQWTTNAQAFLLRRVLAFLSEQKCEKSPRLDKVLPAMRRLITDSEFITIILISSGAGEMRGTGFDSQINEAFRVWRDQQQQARMPFVTVLRACRGQLTHYAVNPAPWQVKLPPLPEELLVARTQPKPAAAAKPKPPPVPPLIMIGKKPELVQTAKPPSPAPTPAPGGPQTNEVSAPPVTPEPLTLVQSDSATPAALAESASRTNLPNPVASKQEVTATIPPPTAPGPSPAPLEKMEVPRAAIDSTSAVALAATRPASFEAVAARSPDPEATGPSGPTPDTHPPHAPFAESRASTQIALSGPPPTLFGWKTGLGIGLVAASLGALLWMWRLRSHRAGHVSLITRSLQREKP